MIYPVRNLKIAPEVYTAELIPALENWCELLRDYGISPQLWFLFGSTVQQVTTDESKIKNPTQTFVNNLLGVRGPSSHSFRSESDIDVGLIVGPGEDEIDLRTYDETSPFRTTKVGGHVLSLTRFTTDWIARRNTSATELRSSQNPTLGIYGQVAPIDL